MNSGNFTHKAQEALFQAQNLAQERGQQQVDALHLLFALLGQEESVVLTLLQKIGADIDGLKRKTETALGRLPVVSAVNPLGQFYLTQDLAKVMERARQEASKMGDEYVSVEHLFLGLLDTNSKAKETLERHNEQSISSKEDNYNKPKLRSEELKIKPKQDNKKFWEIRNRIRDSLAQRQKEYRQEYKKILEGTTVKSGLSDAESDKHIESNHTEKSLDEIREYFKKKFQEDPSLLEEFEILENYLILLPKNEKYSDIKYFS